MNDEFLKKIKNRIGLNGVISLLIGCLILFLPDKMAQIGTFIIGTGFFMIGLVYLIPALKSSNKNEQSSIGHLILGALYVLVGLAALINLSIATNIIFIGVGILVGMTWTLEGVVFLLLTRYLHSNKELLLSGGSSIIAGLFFILVPFWGTKLLWALFGVLSIILGITKIIEYLTWSKRGK